MRILIIEDDARMASLLRQGLAEEGHAIHLAKNGEEGLAVALAAEFEVIVLDITLPGIDGLTVARRLRQASNRTPVLLLTARDSIADVVKGLDTGADDYLTKPFAFEVLLARLRAISRRGPIPQSIALQCADLCLDTAKRRVTRQGQPIHLTPREYHLLELLLRNAGRPVSRTLIMETVWGFHGEVEENTVEAFIRLLRNKIDAPFPVKLIHTVRAFGYCLEAPEKQSFQC